MSPTRTAAALLALAAVLALGGCDRIAAKLPVKLPAIGAAPFDRDRLESAIDGSFGGVGTCVVIADTASGGRLYRYNAPSDCMRRLPPCSTFKIANSLIGSTRASSRRRRCSGGTATPQPVKAWEQDADMKTAFKNSIVWWYQRVAQAVGKPAYQERLRAFRLWR